MFSKSCSLIPNQTQDLCVAVSKYAVSTLTIHVNSTLNKAQGYGFTGFMNIDKYLSIAAGRSVLKKCEVITQSTMERQTEY